MLTRTLSTQETPTPEIIQEQVNERWFYLYEWISEEELQMTLEKDYLNIVKSASMPLAIVTAIVGFIGFSGGIIGTIIAILWVLGLFYFIIGIILFIRFLHRSYLYTRGANIVITDNHFVSWGHVIEQWDTKQIQQKFWKFETIFDEPFLWESRLAEKKEHAKTELFDSLKEIAWGGWKMLQGIWNSRDSWGIIVVILIAGFLYAAMMGIIYFIGIFFISFFGRIFTWMAHRYLMMINNTEHKIQTLFSNINNSSDKLKVWKKDAVSLLTNASKNEWKENLSGQLSESFELIGKLAENATNKTVELRAILESSQYKEIFNFIKYGNWVKKQILEPIKEIILLLEKNHATLKSTISSLDLQISETSDISHRNPLILQKERLNMQVENFQRNIDLLNSYREKLS
jgi:hypothetical protein